MNILVTTFGTSWQIVPELFGFTNPDAFPFFKGNAACEKIRTENDIQPVNELWLISPDHNKKALTPLTAWAQDKPVRLKIITCKNVSELKTETEILTMRSCIYTAVAAAAAETVRNGKGFLYLSLAGGRKTMSADMQDACYLFGCTAILHIIDTFPANGTAFSTFKTESLRTTGGEYAADFLPIVIHRDIPEDFILKSEHIQPPPVMFTQRISPIDETAIYEHSFDGGDTFAHTIQKIKKQSSNLYRNFSESLTTRRDSMERSAFHKLSFLRPDMIARLKAKKIGMHKTEDKALLKKLPKAELHSHLGGVLSSADIIETALAETAYHSDDTDFIRQVHEAIQADDMETLHAIRDRIFSYKSDGSGFTFFYTQLLTFIRSFEHHVQLFDELIFGNYRNSDAFHAIGLVVYQKLGDFQGSALLQTEKTITKALECYVRRLREDNIRYVEIRCSPYKYTRLGLSADEVTDIIIKALNRSTAADCSGNPRKTPIEYRLILIVGRDAAAEAIKNSIEKITALYRKRHEFAEKIAGIDLAGTESKNLPKNLREAFMPLLEHCVSITIHAGETESVESIWQAVYDLTADRIGHGLTLLDKEELIERFLYKNIGIEMCPSSNDQIVGFSQPADKLYPLKQYMNRGLKVTVNTDDCGISRTTLSEEFYKAACLITREEGQYLSVWDCFVLIRNSLSAAFLDKKTKGKLMHEFENELFTLCTEGRLV